MIRKPSKAKIQTELRNIRQKSSQESKKIDEMLSKAENSKYRGNSLLKRAGEKRRYTKEEISEYIKCKNDIVYFVENYMKIVHVDKGLVPFKLYPYQKRILTALHKNRFVIILSCRQSGKSTINIAFMLWFILFHETKRCALLANKGSTSRQILARLKLAYIYLPKFLQQGISDGGWNKGSIELENGSSIIAAATSSDSIRGESISLVFLDEVGFIPNFSDFYRSTYPVISSGQESRIILVSTFNGMNHFYEMWEEAVNNRSGFHPERVDWWEVPGRDEQWEKETRAKLGDEGFDQEFGNEPLGTGNMLLSGFHMKRLISEKMKPIFQDKKIRIYENPKPGRTYMGTIDTSEGVASDSSVITILDITEVPYKIVFMYKDNLISPLNFPSVIDQFGRMYNNAYILPENNGIGGIVANSLNYDYDYPNIITTQVTKRIKTGKRQYELGLRMTGKTKPVGCSVLKVLIETNKLLANEEWMIEDLKHFTKKETALINTYDADPGYHDDCIMTLVLFAFFTTTQSFVAIFDDELKKRIQEDYEEEMMNMLAPIPCSNVPSFKNAHIEKMYQSGEIIGDFDSVMEMIKN